MNTDSADFSPEDALRLLSSLPVGVYISTAQGTITWVNETLCEQLGVAAGDLIGRSRRVLPTRNALSISKSVEKFELGAVAGRSDRWLECISHKHTDGAGNPVEIGCVIDIAHHQLARTLRSYAYDLADKSRIDKATGILTRTAVLQELGKQVSRSRRYNNPLTVMMILLDSVTDADAGSGVDARMAALTTVLKDKLRWVDIIGRWEDNTILLVLPETDNSAAVTLAEKIRGYLAEPADKEAELAAMSGTALQFGIAQWEHGDEASRLIHRAAELLSAKDGLPA